jgi:predicted DCC family thiol-disulfide oxidoreductase YuxK
MPLPRISLAQAVMVDLIYDGQCGFCQRALRLAQRLDSRKRLRLHDATQREAVLRQFPELKDADLADAMFAVDAERRVYRGFFAFRRIVRESPRTWLLLPLFYLPGSGLIGPRVYAWVARNRHRFGCESEVCELPPRPVSK